MIEPSNSLGQVEKKVLDSINHLIDIKKEKSISKMIVHLSVAENSSYIKALFANKDEGEKLINLTTNDVETIFLNLKENFEVPNFVQSLIITLESECVTNFNVNYIPLINLTKNEEES